MPLQYNARGSTVSQLVFPEIYRDFVLTDDDAGHQGRDRTTSLVKSRFYWPGMDGDIEKKVRNCPSCIRRKTKDKTAANLVVVESTYPMELVCMDFLSLGMSSGGHEHIFGHNGPFYSPRTGVSDKKLNSKNICQITF